MPVYQPIRGKTKARSFRALDRLHVLHLKSDWLTELFVSTAITQTDFSFPLHVTQKTTTLT